MIQDNDQTPCEWCGELHPMSTAEKLFVAECERRGLPWQPGVMPEQARGVATMTSILVAPLGASLDGAPGLLSYFAAALAALSQEADLHAEQAFKELGGDLDDIPEGEAR